MSGCALSTDGDKRARAHSFDSLRIWTKAPYSLAFFACRREPQMPDAKPSPLCRARRGQVYKHAREQHEDLLRKRPRLQRTHVQTHVRSDGQRVKLELDAASLKPKEPRPPPEPQLRRGHT